MTKQFRLFVAAIFSVFLLGACALGDGRPPATLYDFGPLKTDKLVQLPAGMPIIKTRVQAPEWMSENLMYYRLNYVNDQQVRFYTESSWNTTPSRLFKNRLDAIIASAGTVVTGFRTNSPTLTLRVYIEDFGQHFTSASASVGHVSLRVSLFRGKELIAQRSFIRDIPSTTADAAGGVRAMTEATDAVIADILNWMVTSMQGRAQD